MPAQNEYICLNKNVMEMFVDGRVRSLIDMVLEELKSTENCIIRYIVCTLPHGLAVHGFLVIREVSNRRMLF